MRDPVFYRVHTFVDDIFQLHKSKLNPYTAQQLTFPGIVVNSIQVQETTAQARPNVLNTFWQQSDVNLSRGWAFENILHRVRPNECFLSMDFLPRGDVFVRFTHLQHIPFNYSFNVTNNSGAQRLGMARIFLGVRNGFNRQPMNFNTQRIMMMEMDKFPIQSESEWSENFEISTKNSTLQCVRGRTRSTDGPATLWWPFLTTKRSEIKTLDALLVVMNSKNLKSVVVDGPITCKRTDAGKVRRSSNCCLSRLIPRGTPAGQKFDLYVMVSNYEEDRIDQDLVGACTQASAYCGIRDRKFPDRKASKFQLLWEFLIKVQEVMDQKWSTL